ncbi:GlcNAc transferase [Campylobacter sp. faydin G-140]|uniref:CiaD-like domain-containing protein n=1 Tax=Campylobacter anatolicus TaxID=2829105 RepID=UPI001B9FCB3E|nr:GlcNAc transferase [Campylobacter anatolicus]MBR8462187.1 GlcNAc transferase [Campylobacter anatolicus]MBR8466392.1 GlcNAc transferase [Campylobacter anatolicus]
MKLDDIAKMAIDEVSAELEKIERLTKQNLQEKTQIKTQENTTNDDLKVFEASENIAKKDEKNSEKEINSAEEIFLKNLRERVEVLFEGLNETPKDELQSRLELTLKFLEFVLASVENRLKNLSK